MRTIDLPFDVTLPPVTHLKAGLITCVYEEGKLRYIKKGAVEILRMIYVAVRDKNWATIPYKIEEEEIKTDRLSFSIRYSASYELNDIQYKTLVEIKGAEDNTISFNLRGEALSSFYRNRIGLCILHPMKECARTPAIIHSPEGTSHQSVFPKSVSPHQPFKNIQQLDWKISDQINASISFRGDVFETEDQRNWSDNSFKTYSTPLDIPYPVLLKQGDIIEQSMSLSVVVEDKEEPFVQTSSEETKIPFPKIGYGRSEVPLTKMEIDLLRKVPFDHYRVELRMAQDDWQKTWQLAVEEAKQLDTKIELIVFFNKNSEEELQNLLETLKPSKNLVKSLLPLHDKEKITPPVLLNLVYTKIKEQLGNLKVGYGTDVNFVEVNRNPPGNICYDFLSFGLNPQLHATDTRTIIENLDAQKDVLTAAQGLGDGKEIYISPVTINKRNAQTGDRETTDQRFHSSFGAIWTLVTLHNLSEAGSISFYETTGFNGLLKKNNGYEQVPGSEETDIYKVLKEIKEFGAKWIITNNDDEIKNFILENEEGERLIFSFPGLHVDQGL